MLKTLRWLLVFLLPVAGFYLGSQVSPGIKPLWEVTFNRVMVFQGIVEEGRTLLLIERDANAVLDGNTLQYVVGLDTSTGKERFRRKLPESLSSVIGLTTRYRRISPDGSYILLNDERRRVIKFFDWRKNEVVKEFQCQTDDPYMMIQSVILRGNTLGVSGFTFYTDRKLQAFAMFWDTATAKLKATIPIGNPGEQPGDLILSDDGLVAMAVVAHNSSWQHKLIDTVTGKVFDPKPDNQIFHEIRWDTRHQRFRVLAQEQGDLLLEDYERQGASWKPIARKPISQTPISSLHCGPHFTVMHCTSWKRTYLWIRTRDLLERLFGAAGKTFLEKIWPNKIIVSMLHTESGEVMRSVTLPDCSDTVRPIHFLLDDSLDKVYMSGDYLVTCWPFHDPSEWPKWLGLCIGLLIAILLARRNLRLTTRSSALLCKPSPI